MYSTSIESLKYAYYDMNLQAFKVYTDFKDFWSKVT